MTHLVIIAGGRGTRLSAETGDRPKALMPIAGKPVLLHQLELAASCGVTEVTIVAGHLGESIRAFAAERAPRELQVRVLVESTPMGTAGGVLAHLDSFPQHFFVMYGDVMAAVDLERFGAAHLSRRADFTAFVHPNDHPFDSDLVETNGEGWITRTHLKPHADDAVLANLVNAALYAVRRDALRPWTDRMEPSDFVRDVMTGLVASGRRVLAYRSAEYIKDMGTVERLRAVEADWRAGRIGPARDAGGHRAVFLDRDGTLNVEKGHLRHAGELEILPGVTAALRKLRQSGYLLVVLTNQPVVARGEATEAAIAEVHRRLEWELGREGAYVDGIFVCPHHPDGGFEGERVDLKIACACRKPGIGLFERACDELGIAPAQSWMVGDQTRDIEMARRAGLRSILVRTGAAGRDGACDATPDYVAEDLHAAAQLILEQERISAS